MTVTHHGPPAEPDEALAVRTEELTKRFRSGQVAVNGVGLRVPAGAVYGFLGPNGSGKTTTIRMLLGLAQPSSGNVWLLGQPIPARAQAVLPEVGALVEGPAFHPYLTGRANLRRLDDVDATTEPRTQARRVEEALARVGLEAAGAKPYRQYSLGMKQRLGLAAALLRPRRLYVLDEPTNGLDPQGTREVRHLIADLAAAGSTVVVSSHLLAEIDQICSHIGVMGEGRLLAQSDRASLLGRGRSRVVVQVPLAQRSAASEVMSGLGLGVDEGGEASGQALEAPLGKIPPEKIAAALVHGGLDLLGLQVVRPTLEQVFVELTGEGFDVAR